MHVAQKCLNGETVILQNCKPNRSDFVILGANFTETFQKILPHYRLIDRALPGLKLLCPFLFFLGLIVVVVLGHYLQRGANGSVC